MSMFNPATLPCPNCATENTFDVFASVNADRRPDLTDDILAGNLMRVKCSKCGTEFRPEPDLSYLDAERRLWIMARPIHRLRHWDLEEAEAATIYADAYGENSPAAAREIGIDLRPRLTFGWPGFREKLVIAGSQLDDVIVEEMKIIILRDRPGNPLQAGMELRLLGVYGATMNFGWVTTTTNQATSVFEAQRALYDSIAGNPDWADMGKSLSAGMFVDTQRLFIVPEPMPAAA